MRDIEELAALGKEEGTCAYYGARKAASLAQVSSRNASFIGVIGTADSTFSVVKGGLW